ncbi:MAG: hypothetical protein MUF49_22505, partial [Oculatellaceae cyanobacterium Prado106]|nr:hypothetical protein [Oculatellaceae cyanobacterium Prado106]
YLQIAGFGSAIADSWQDLLLQLQHQSVDLVLFCGDPAIAFTRLLQPDQADQLAALPAKPPMLFWHTPPHRSRADQQARKQFETWWGRKVQILPPTLSMPELLAKVSQVLTGHQHRN